MVFLILANRNASRKLCKLISTYLSSTFGELELHLSLLSRIPSSNIITVQAPVVWRVENAIHQINHYPVDSAIGFANTYPLGSDLSGG